MSELNTTDDPWVFDARYGQLRGVSGECVRLYGLDARIAMRSFTEEQLANARLAVSAPELYTVLLYARERIQMIEDAHKTLGCPSSAELLNMIDAVLEKASGEVA